MPDWSCLESVIGEVFEEEDKTLSENKDRAIVPLNTCDSILLCILHVYKKASEDKEGLSAINGITLLYIKSNARLFRKGLDLKFARTFDQLFAMHGKDTSPTVLRSASQTEKQKCSTKFYKRFHKL